MSLTAQVPMKNTKNILETDGDWRFLNIPLFPKPLFCGFGDVADSDKTFISINVWIYGGFSVLIDKPTTSLREINKIFVNSLTIDPKLTKLRESCIRTSGYPLPQLIYVTVKNNDGHMNDVSFHTKLLKSAE